MRSSLKFTILFIFIAVTQTSFGQCSMCKAVAESNLNDGGATAIGLNNGIMYLMAFPYIMIAGVAFVWYRNKKLNKA